MTFLGCHTFAARRTTSIPLHSATPRDMASSVDLDAYVSRYSGFTKVQRLLFIAEKSPALQGARFACESTTVQAFL